MKRLTTTNKDVTREMICRNEDCGAKEEHCPHLMEDECACLREVINKLADYEDAEEQGLLLRLKVRPGDSLYKPNPITLKEIVEIRIESIFITESGINISGRTTERHYSYCCSPSDIGKTVFLTSEEAEAALAEKGGLE